MASVHYFLRVVALGHTMMVAACTLIASLPNSASPFVLRRTDTSMKSFLNIAAASAHTLHSIGMQCTILCATAVELISTYIL